MNRFIKQNNPQVWPRELMSTLMNQFLLGGLDDESSLSTNVWSPAIDIKEEANQFVVFADLPGIDPKDIHLSLDHGFLTIKGERKFSKREEKEGFARMERFEGQYYRRLSLPELTNEEGIQAHYKTGVLEVVIPKKNGSHTKRIEVKVTDH